MLKLCKTLPSSVLGSRSPSETDDCASKYSSESFRLVSNKRLNKALKGSML